MTPSIHITPAEQTVLYWLCKGLRNAEICRETGMALGTVKTHLGSLQKKTGTKTRLQLVIYTYETKIIDIRGLRGSAGMETVLPPA